MTRPAGLLALLLARSLGAQADTINHWPLGSRVHASNTVYARADSTPFGPILCPCPHAIGDRGTLVGGPVGPVADGSIRWKVAYDTPPSGWSTQRYLALDSVPAPPPSGPVFVDMGPLLIGLMVGQEARATAVPYDSAHQVTGTAISWSVLDTALARVIPYGNGVTQVGRIMAQRPGSTWVQARAGAAMGQLRLRVLPFVPPPPPPPPAAPVFGVSTTRWVGLTNCLPVIGTTCTRIFPILADSDGHILVRATVVATFASP